MLEKFFKLKENNTNVRTEILAGFTTFVTMAYILFVNPSVLSIGGMDKNAVLLATAIGSGLVTIGMGLYANYPIALAPGLDLNAFYVYTVILGMGISWQVALGAIFISGIVFVLLTVSNVRQLIISALPLSLKYAITVGIGLFVVAIGLKLSGIMTIKLSLLPDTVALLSANSGSAIPKSFESLILMGDFKNLQVALSFFGLVVTLILVAKNIRGALIISVLITTIASVMTGYTTLPANFSPVAIPDFSRNAFFALDIMGALEYGLFTLIITFTFVDLFNTLGTLIGVATKANIIDKDGNFPRIEKALMVDAVGTSLGALLGTSTITAYLESVAGIGAGGRTGLTSVVCGLLFILSLVFSPIFLLIPDVATAPVLIVVGFFMVGVVCKIDFEDYSEALPAFLTIIFMPFTFSIVNGICMGLFFYPLIKVLCGKRKEVHWMMYILAVLVFLRTVYM